MQKSGIVSIIAVALLLGFQVPVSYCCQGEPATAGQVQTQGLDVDVTFGDYFIENQGQLDADIHYYAIGNPSVAFKDDGIMFVFSNAHQAKAPQEARFRATQKPGGNSHAYFLRFDGSQAKAPTGKGEFSFRSHYFLGNDSDRWVTGVPSFREVVYEDLWDGVNLAYTVRTGQLKYELTVEPGANLNQILLSLEGIDSVTTDIAGNLVVTTSLGSVVDSAPYSYTGQGEVSCNFVLRGDSTYGFDCPDLDNAETLIIDPLVYSTFLGTSSWGYVSIGVDTDGSAYIAGRTEDVDFPTTPGAFDTTLNSTDLYVAKLNANGSNLAFATFIGGDRQEGCRSIDVDLAGNAYLTGYTTSEDFPVTPGAFDNTYNGTDIIGDAFVIKLNATGSALVFSTYLSGDGGWDTGRSIRADLLGNAYVTGDTNCPDFPVTPGAFDTTFHGDAFVAKFNATGAIIYSTFLGGESEGEGGRGIATDESGSAYVTGLTYSSDFPATPGAFDTTFNAETFKFDAFVAKINANGSALEYATYLGSADSDSGKSIDVDPLGRAYILGAPGAEDFPITPGAFDVELDTTAGDMFIVRLSADGSTLEYGTYYGGSHADWGTSVAVDSVGNAYITGETLSSDLPTSPDAFADSLIGEGDAFVAKLDASGSNLVYGTYIGGSTCCDFGVDDSGESIAVDSIWNAYVTGWTCGADFPVTPSAFDTTYNGGMSNFVVKLNLTPLPDLTVRSSDLHTTPSSPIDSGTLVDIHANVSNAGWADAANITVLAFDDHNGNQTPDTGEMIGSEIIETITTANSSQVSFQWMANVPGNHALCAWADPPPSEILEMNETNNAACLDVEVVSPEPPSSPRNLLATASSQEATLTWEAPLSDGGSPVTNYQIYRGTSSGGEIFLAEIGNITRYDDLGLVNGQTYFYEVSARNSVGEGPRSNEANCTPATVPGPPQGLMATAGNREVALSWSEPLDDGGLPITNYSIYRGLTTEELTFLITIGNAVNYSDAGLTNDVTYFYKVAAVNAIGAGANSTEVNATPFNQAPICSIATPSSGAELSGVITITGIASDVDGAVERVEIRMDDDSWITVAGMEAWSYDWNTTGVSDGNHTIQARSYDGANYSDEVSVTVVVNNYFPPPSEEDSILLQAWFWAAIIVVAVVLLVLVILLRRRRKPEEE